MRGFPTGGNLSRFSGKGYFGPAGPAPNIQTFTAVGAGTWTRPTPPAGKSIKQIIVTLVGGGGGGQSGNSNLGSSGGRENGGCGGSGAATSVLIFAPATMQPTMPVNVGAGGAGGVGIPTNVNPGNGAYVSGSDGTASTFGTFGSGFAFASAGNGFGAVSQSADTVGGNVFSSQLDTSHTNTNGPAGKASTPGAPPYPTGIAGPINSVGVWGGGSGGNQDSAPNIVGPGGTSEGAAGGVSVIFSATPAGVGISGSGGGTSTTPDNSQGVINATAGNGGDALATGSGGGGGGAARSTTGTLATPGNGGAGAKGIVVVQTIFG